MSNSRLFVGAVAAGAFALLVAADNASAFSHGSWGSYGSSGSSASYGSSGSSASYGSYGSSGSHGGLFARWHARKAARRAAHSHGSYGSSGSSASYGSYGSSGSSASYGSYGSTGSAGAVIIHEHHDHHHGHEAEGEPVPADDSASIEVTVPADATVKVNGKATTSEGEVRSFVSRGLKAGLTYSYKLEVSYGDSQAEVKTVQLRAGQKTSLTFGEDQPEVATKPEATKTSLKVSVPENAKVFLSGTETSQTGEERTYVTTRLAPGAEWSDYTVRVELERDGRTLVRQKTLAVLGGESYELAFDFADEAVAQLAQAK